MADIHKITKNGETILPATTTDAIVHPQMETSLTNMINEYNVSKLFPTGGVDGGDTYTLEGAIALLNSKLTASQKTVGIKLAFKDNGTIMKEYLYKGDNIENVNNWEDITMDNLLNEINHNVVAAEAKISAFIRELYLVGDWDKDDVYISSIRRKHQYGTGFVLVNSDNSVIAYANGDGNSPYLHTIVDSSKSIYAIIDWNVLDEAEDYSLSKGVKVNKTCFDLSYSPTLNLILSGYIYKGIATTNLNPSVSNLKIFYIAITGGTYVNFNNIVVDDGEVAILKWDGDWTKDTIWTKDRPTNEYSFDLTNGASNPYVDVSLEYYSKTAHTIFTNTGYRLVKILTKYIDIVSLNFKSRKSDSTAIAYLDKNGNYLSSVSNDTDEEKIYTLSDLNIPENCEYILLSIEAYNYNDSYPDFSLEYSVDGYSAFDNILRIRNGVFALNGEVTSIAQRLNGYYITSSNTFQTHPSLRTYVFDINYIKLLGLNLKNVANSLVYTISYFDKYNQFISGTVAEDNTQTISDLDIPSSCRYIALTWDSYGNTSSIEVNGEFNLSFIKNEPNFSNQYEIVYIGDSITSGTYGNYAEESYNLMKKDMPELKYVNYGIHSGTSESIATVNGGMQLTNNEQVTIPADTNSAITIKLSRNIHNHWGSIIGNPYDIMGIKGNFKWLGGEGNFSNTNYEFTRLENGFALDLQPNTPIVSDAVHHNLNAHILSIFIGTNNDLASQDGCNAVIDMVKRISKLSKNGHFIIIAPFVEKLNPDYYFPEINKEFANKVIDLYHYFRQNAVQDAIDLDYISSEEASGKQWYEILLDTGEINDLHPSVIGYHLIAKKVYDKVKLLGYLS